MGLKAYYDGSGKNGGSTKVLTLAGYAANESLWPDFERRWGEILSKNKLSALHMTDAMSLNGEFSSEMGWDHERVAVLLGEFLRCISASGLAGYSCSVILEEHSKAKLQIAQLRKPEALCVNHCVGGLQLTAADFDTPKPIILFFDRGETFLHTINAVWERSKNWRRGWARQVASISPVDSSQVLPVQAADLLAWSVGRHYTYGDHEWLWIGSMIGKIHYHKLFNFETIIAEYPNG